MELVLLAMVMFFALFAFGCALAPLDITREMYQPWRAEKTFPSVHNHFVTDAALHYIP